MPQFYDIVGYEDALGMVAGGGSGVWGEVINNLIIHLCTYDKKE